MASRLRSLPLWQRVLWFAVPIGVAAGGVTVASVHSNQHQAEPTVQAKVLGEKFTPSTGDSAGGATVKPAGSTGNGHGGGNNGNGLGNGGGAKLTFTLSGSVADLVPGEQNRVLPVLVSNPDSNNGTLTVKTLSGVAADVTSGNDVLCAGSNFVVTGYDASSTSATPYVIPRGGSATVPLPILFKDLSGTDQNSCRGQTVVITLSGSATVTR